MKIYVLEEYNTGRIACISKENLIKAINEAFPDDILIASVSTVEMTDGTKTQSVCFGKILDV